ncbi:MAG: VPLPA-CTERM sorting domain-containing protein [Parvularculaceae bacterium]
MTSSFGRSIAIAAAMTALSGGAQAATVWTNWQAGVVGANSGGLASGSVNGVSVDYVGELDSITTNGTDPRWNPASTFIGGASTASPSVVGDAIFLNGSGTGVNTITFGSPVENPLIAIWSLGAPGIPATFSFNQTPTLQAGGPNSQFAGSTITVNGNVVSGIEGNGVIMFLGTFASISWTNTFENFYSFTVGAAGPLNGTDPVPVPGAVVLMLTGLGALGAAMRRKTAAHKP